MAKPKTGRTKSFIFSITYRHRSMIYKGVAIRMLRSLKYHTPTLPSLSSIIIEVVNDAIGNPTPPQLQHTNKYTFFTQMLPHVQKALIEDSKNKGITVTQQLHNIIFAKELESLNIERSDEIDANTKRISSSYKMPFPFKYPLIIELARRLSAGKLPINKSELPSINDIVEEAIADYYHLKLPTKKELGPLPPDHEIIKVNMLISEEMHQKYKDFCKERNMTMNEYLLRSIEHLAIKENW